MILSGVYAGVSPPSGPEQPPSLLKPALGVQDVEDAQVLGIRVPAVQGPQVLFRQRVAAAVEQCGVVPPRQGSGRIADPVGGTGRFEGPAGPGLGEVIVQGGEQAGVQIGGRKSRAVKQGEGQRPLRADTVEVQLLQLDQGDEFVRRRRQALHQAATAGLGEGGLGVVGQIEDAKVAVWVVPTSVRALREVSALA